MPTSDGTIYLTQEQMARFERHFSETPRFRMMRDLILEYTGAQGGLTLEFWRSSQGIFFGEPVLRTMAAVAERLDVPVSELHTVWNETWDWVRPQLDADAT